MIWVAVVALASLSGAMHARRHGGRGVDMAQYAAVWGIAATLAATILWIVVSRLFL